jgi:hypothetical protein
LLHTSPWIEAIPVLPLSLAPGVYAWVNEINIIFLSDQPLERLLLVVADAVFPSTPEGGNKKY